MYTFSKYSSLLFTHFDILFTPTVKQAVVRGGGESPGPGNHLKGLQNALEDMTEVKLTAEARRDVNGILKYMRKFECVFDLVQDFKLRQ